MKKKIVNTIDAGDDRCGECRFRMIGSYSDNRDWCDLHTEDSDELKCITGGQRVDRCLAAERNLAALIAAGDALDAACEMENIAAEEGREWVAAKKEVLQ